MNKSIFLLFFILVTLISCETDSIRGSKKLIKKNYNLADFTKIDASNTYSVKITQGKNYKIELTCNENILEFIDIQKDDETLVLDVKGSHSFSNITLKVNITVPTIEKIKASGATKIKVSKLNLDHLKIDLSGASSLKGELKIRELIDIEASGASSLKIQGEAMNANFDFSGASKLNAKEFNIINKLIVDASGASSCSVFSKKGSFEMESSGASSIKYYGKGKVLKKEESGAGSIEKMFKV